ncbi:hypothetical protein F5148DRAFT_1294246 [Russula earlei]|uniref:Uncharacterized protein n=1 Tax=Russula earlei TaxID=71964 RepID=A0ACC0TRP7_9AGAM|nr:hypothetical protein F5148DRAFT_1294246 [Russula earlei]
MTWDVCDKFVGPMPIAEFLSEFVPEASQARKTERIISFDKRSVSHNEDHFIQAIKTSGLADNLTFFRVFSYSIILFGKAEGRLLQWDRSGAIYTEIFNWTKNPNTLSEFIWRLNSLTFAQRGYDTTVTSVSKNDKGVGDAQSTLAVYMDVEKIEVEDLRQILVNDDHATDGQAEALYHMETNMGDEKPFLVDYWRTNFPGIEKEGDIYCDLLEAKVRFIPELGPAGDVLSTPEHSLDVQCTRTQDYVKDGERKRIWCPSTPRVKRYVHYRLVLNTLGQPLSTFGSTRELCQVIRDAMIAHTDAYNKAKILHWDVSTGNILIAPDRSGLLIDWDMSKRVDVTQQRQHSRTGTWQFISTGLLLHPHARSHQISDDIESFYWVLIYIVMKCRHSAIEGQSQDMQRVFDGYRDVDEDGVIRGSDGKLSFLHKLMLHPDTFGFVPEPCRQIIEELRTLLKTFYDDINPKSIMPEPQAERNVRTEVKDAHEKLCSSEWVLNLITRNLESKNWSDDDGSLSKNIVGHDPTFSRGCRKRKAKDDDSPVEKEMGLSFNKKRRGRYPPKGSSLSRYSLSAVSQSFPCPR